MSDKKGAAAAAAAGDAPTPEAIGWAGWTILHTTAAAYPNVPSEQHRRDMRDFIRSWSRVYPCSICAYHMRQQLQVMPPDVSNKRALSRWTCELHNSVNTMLGKDAVDCDPETVLKRWHPTYPHMDDEPSPEELLAKHAQQRAEQTHKQAAAAAGASMASRTTQLPTSAGILPKGTMSAGWGARSDGGNTGVPDSATDVDAVLKRLSSCKAFCPEKKA